MTGPVEKVVCLIGTWRPSDTVVRMETYRGDSLVDEEEFGFGPTLPLAELVRSLREQLRNDAQAKGAELAIFEIPAPYGREQFEEVAAARRAAVAR